MIEEFVSGREIQVAIMGNKKLGAIELRPKRKFYDYKAKYNSSAKTEHKSSKFISKKMKQLLDIALKAHKIMAAKELQDQILNFTMENFIY